jgi:ABC-type polysaccharide/polyol phosphate export permease
VSIVLTNFINFLFGFIVMLPIFTILNPEVIKYILPLLLIMFLHFIFTLGISLLFSIVNVYFRDLSQLLNVGIMFLFWATPIFYPMEIIPRNYHWIILANPATCYVIIYRSLLYNGSFGEISMWFLAVGFAFISLISGYTLFIKKEKDILKYV